MPPKKRSTRSQAKPEPESEEEEKPKTRTRGKRADSPEVKGGKKVKKDDIVEDKKAKSKAAKKDMSPEKSEEEEKKPAKEAVKKEKDEEMKKVVMKGKAPVDQYVPNASNYQVYEQGGEVFATTLNQSNVSANNNKFYILQVLVNSSNPKSVCFFTRWGRVGVPGQNAPIMTDDPAFAISWYRKKKREKMNGGYR